MDEFKIDPQIAYDVVELPSKGIYYNNKKSVRVAYLTAADENILASANLIASGGVIEELIRRKVLDRDITPEDMVEEDRQAILIFLRNTAWGSDYHMTFIDPVTKKEFETVIDLSRLKIKDFKLVADTNGEYSYHMKKSKVDITFKFLSRKEEDELDKIRESWNGNGVAPVVTKRLELSIKSINGSRNQMEIRNFIHDKLPISDSQDFRKFVNDNKPGVDLTQDVETPSKEIIQVSIGFGAEFFRPFYGL